MRTKRSNRLVWVLVLTTLGIFLVTMGGRSLLRRQILTGPERTPRMASNYLVEWNFTWGGNNDDELASVVVDENGNGIACGRTGSWGSGLNDTLTLKMNPDGTIAWNKTLGGWKEDEAYSIACDNLGRAVVTGGISSWGAGNETVHAAQYNATGDLNWNSTVKASWIDTGRGIAIDRNNTLYVAGYSFDAKGTDALLAKFAPGGQAMETYRWNQSGLDYGQAVAVDLLNNVYLAGCFYNNSYFDVFVAKFTTNLVSVWNQTWGGNANEIPYGVTVDAAGNVYVAGETASFGNGSADCFLVKYNAEGTRLWNKTWGGTGADSARAIAVDRLGCVFLVGQSKSWGATSGDLIVLKFNGSGGLQWNYTYGGPGFEMGSGISVERNGEGVWVVGYTTSWGAKGRDALLLKLADPMPYIPQLSQFTTAPGGKLSWTITDATTAGTQYIVYQDGMVVQSGIWTSGDEIEVTVPTSITVGANYTIIAWDGLGDVTSSTVYVLGNAFDWVWIWAFAGAIGLLFFYLLVVRPRLQGRRGLRKALGVLMMLGVVGFVVLPFTHPWIWFSTAGRYDASQLTTMGVPFASAGDIYAFNEGYSEDSTAPWGFIHTGIDYAFKNNSPVLATAPGIVLAISLRESNREIGDINKYHVEMAIRFSALYIVHFNFEPWTDNPAQGDLQAALIRVRVGDWVVKGQVIATFLKVSEGAHVHYTVSEGMLPPADQPPTRYLSGADYLRLLDLMHGFHPAWMPCYAPNAGDDYPSTRLDYMGVLFVSVADNRDFRGGYSSSSNCPWGFAHTGLDFFLKNNSKVLATAPGQVVDVEEWDNGAGADIRWYIRLKIQFSSTITLQYSFELKTDDHANITRQLALIWVEVGDWVQPGQEIARFYNCGGDPDHIDFGVLDTTSGTLVRACPQGYFSPAGLAKMVSLKQAFGNTYDFCYA